MNQATTHGADPHLIKSLIEEQYSYVLTNPNAYISYIPRPFIELCVGNHDLSIIPARQNTIVEGIFDTIWRHYLKVYPHQIFSRKDDALAFLKNCLIILRRAHENGITGDLPPLSLFSILTMPTANKIFMDFAAHHGLTVFAGGVNYKGIEIIN